MSARLVSFWKTTALYSVVLIVIAAAWLLLDMFTSSGSGGEDEVLAIAVLVGILMIFISLAGWATQLGRQARVLMAIAIFLVPCLLLFLGNLADGLNIHGSGGPVLILALIFAVMGVVFLIMAAAAKKKS